jgi:hypothetical protein
VGQSNTQNSVFMGHTNTLMVDSSECSGSHPLLPNLTVCTDNTCNINMSNTLQQTLPLGAMVSDTIKNQIWANEYVDLGILLPNGDVKSQVFPIVVNGVGNEKKLALQENSKQIKTLDQWISAFAVYMTIYCQKKIYCSCIRTHLAVWVMALFFSNPGFMVNGMTIGRI